MKRLMVLLMLAAVVTPTLTGCYGKFAMTRKIYQLNGSVSDRYVRSLVTWAFLIVPVYEVGGVIDFVVLNTIEFWSGRNLMTSGEKTFHYSKGDENYRIKAVKDGEMISCTIDRYDGGRYQDTLTFSSDWDGGRASAKFLQAGRVSEYTANDLGLGGDSLHAALALPSASSSAGVLYR